MKRGSIVFQIDNIKNICLLLCGFFCTMPVFSIGGLNFYNYPLFIYIIINLFRGKIFLSREKLSMSVLLVSLFISTLLSFSIVPPDWSNYSLKFSFKISISWSVTCTQWAAMAGTSKSPFFSAISMGVQPYFS